MTPGDLIRLAWLGLRRRRVRSLLTGVGIAVAVMSMVVFMSLGAGIQRTFTDELDSVGPDLEVSRAGLTQGLAPVPTLGADVAVKIASASMELGIEQVTPIAVIRRLSFDASESTIFYGVPPDQGIQALFSRVQVGSGRDIRAGDVHRSVAVLGARTARNLGLRVGDTLRLNRRATALVVGVLRPENTLTDTLTFLPIEAVQKAFNAGTRLSMVAVRLRRPQDAPSVAATLAGRLNLEAITRAEYFRFIGRLLRLIGVTSLGLSLIALLVGGLAVINTVMAGVHERLGEFATLRAIGARPKTIRALVLVESTLLSLTGGFAGLLLGLLGVAGVNAYAQSLAAVAVAAVTAPLLLLTLGVSLLLGLLAGLVPARAAGRATILSALGKA